MSIASELTALNGYILGAYDEINTKGGTVPANKNMANLASAIASIPKRRPLPEGYTEVEWLQSDGACYIDTNRTPNMNDIIEQKFMSLNTTTDTCSWYGSMPGRTALVPRICMGISGVGFFAAVNNTIGFASIDNEIHIIKWQQNTATTLYIDYDGTETISPSGSGYDPAVELTSYLFARHGTNGVQVYDGTGTRIYYHKEYLSNGTIQLDLVPVIRNSDNEPGMYDLVSKTFFTNSGSGTLTVGPLVNFPSGYTQLEYIESTGTEYIDLGIKGTENTKVDIEFQATGTGFGPFGAREAATRGAFAIWASSNNVGTALRIGFDSTSGYTGPNTTNDKYHIISSKEGAYVNGINVWTPDDDRTFETPGTLIVFGYRASSYSSGITLCMMKLFALKLWKNNVLIQNLIPARRNSDNVLGMYDLVFDTFYTNAGSGSFTAGPVIG